MLLKLLSKKAPFIIKLYLSEVDIELYNLIQGGPIPQNMAKTFDGPPTLERSGSEHRRAVTSFLLRRKAWLEVELPLERETEGFEKIPSLMGKRDASECNESCFQIAECSSLYQQGRTG